MTKAPLFSIITITYNNLDGLKRTRKSVKAQTNTDFEWIIIDGAGYSFVFFVDGLIVMLPILLLPFMVPRKGAEEVRPMSAPMPEAS